MSLYEILRPPGPKGLSKYNAQKGSFNETQKIAHMTAHRIAQKIAYKTNHKSKE